jgi:hypothetical protein
MTLTKREMFAVLILSAMRSRLQAPMTESLLDTGAELAIQQADALFLALGKECAPDPRVAELEDVLRSIVGLGGNLPDSAFTDPTGPNDAAHRGLLYVTARAAANAALAP